MKSRIPLFDCKKTGRLVNKIVVGNAARGGIPPRIIIGGIPPASAPGGGGGVGRLIQLTLFNIYKVGCPTLFVEYSTERSDPMLSLLCRRSRCVAAEGWLELYSSILRLR